MMLWSLTVNLFNPKLWGIYIPIWVPCPTKEKKD